MSGDLLSYPSLLPCEHRAQAPRHLKVPLRTPGRGQPCIKHLPIERMREYVKCRSRSVRQLILPRDRYQPNPADQRREGFFYLFEFPLERGSYSPRRKNGSRDAPASSRPRSSLLRRSICSSITPERLSGTPSSISAAARSKSPARSASSPPAASGDDPAWRS